MPTFDVVSEVDQHELNNAVDHAQKEIATRFDFKGTSAKVELADGNIMLHADSDFQIQQIHPVLYQKLTARKIDIACLDTGKVENSGKGVKQLVKVKQGIDKEVAKKAMARIATDPDLSARLSAGGRAWIEDEFNIVKSARTIAGFFAEIATNSKEI